jgi:hypothetical protein
MKIISSVCQHVHSEGWGTPLPVGCRLSSGLLSLPPTLICAMAAWRLKGTQKLKPTFTWEARWRLSLLLAGLLQVSALKCIAVVGSSPSCRSIAWTRAVLGSLLESSRSCVPSAMTMLVVLQVE